MSPKQRGMLFGLWKKVVAMAGWDTAEAENQRAEFTIAVLKPGPRDAIPSWSDLKPRQIDALTGALTQRLRGGLDLVETPAGLLSSADFAAYTRLCHGIETDAVAAYGCVVGAEQAIISILEDMLGRTFTAGEWRKLSLPELAKLRKTAAHRRRSKFAQSAGN